MKNETIWINHQAYFKPDTYTFKNGFVTYYIEEYRLYAQIWKASDNNDKWRFIAYLHNTVEIIEGENKSMKEIIDG